MESEEDEKRSLSLRPTSKPESSSASSIVSSIGNNRETGQQEQQLPDETDWKSLSQILVSFCLTFNTWGLVNSFGVYQTYYATTGVLGKTTQSQLSWIGSVQGFLILAILVVTGPLFDRGHARSLTCVGSFLVVLGMMMTSLAHKYWQVLLSQGFCIGLGHGCLFIVAVGQVSLTFKRRRWMAIGIAQSGGSVGAIIYSIVFREVQARAGAGWATRTIGFIAVVMLAVASILLRPHKLEKPRKVFHLRAFRNKSFNFFALASFAGFMGLYVPFFYIQQYSSSIIGAEGDLAFYTLAMLNAGSVVGRIVPGFIADHLGLLNTYTISTVGAAILAFAWIACRSMSGIIAFAIFYGFFAGCAAALQPAVLASLCTEANLVGTWVGMGSLFSSAGLLLGNPLGGQIFHADGGQEWLGIQLWPIIISETTKEDKDDNYVPLSEEGQDKEFDEEEEASVATPYLLNVHMITKALSEAEL
ncbi:hypothetical protein MBLNU13_g05326t2 [Cladosporium sp. NU13]